jgi:magnesium transporter
MSTNPFNPLESSTPVMDSAPAAPAIDQPVASATQARPENSQPSQASSSTRKRKGHRGGKKKRQRRKSFAIMEEDAQAELGEATHGEGFYQQPRGNLSGTSIDSEALLDHR